MYIDVCIVINKGTAPWINVYHKTDGVHTTFKNDFARNATISTVV